MVPSSWFQVPDSPGFSLLPPETWNLLLEDRLPQDFFQGRYPAPDLVQARGAEADHSLLDRLAFQLDRGRSRENHLADLVGELEDLVEADPALVAGVAAPLASAAALDLEALDLIRGEAHLDEHLRRRLDLFGAAGAD